MDVLEKLTILTDSAKYDVACTSSGSERPGDETGLGSTVAAGLCHAFAADGRCISLLKVLLSNCCVYDCKYCVNRVTNDVPRAAFTPRELADLTIGFYRRNYIEGLFLSSAVLRSPDYTMEQMIGVLELLRNLMVPRLQESIGWMSFALPMQYYLVTYAALILVGVIIGLFGSAIAMRRYLRV